MFVFRVNFLIFLANQNRRNHILASIQSYENLTNRSLSLFLHLGLSGQISVTLDTRQNMNPTIQISQKSGQYTPNTNVFGQQKINSVGSIFTKIQRSKHRHFNISDYKVMTKQGFTGEIQSGNFHLFSHQ